jgi:putative membrane protein
MTRDYKKMAGIYLKGVAMGAADAVPGVSGGTIALITGIYQRLISALTGLTSDSIISLLESFLERDYGSVRDQLDELDFSFLAFLGAGIMTSLLLVLNFMHFMLSSFTVMTYGFFFGLIAISAVILYSEIDLEPRRNKVVGLTGLLTAFLLSGYGVTSLGNSLPVLFLAGCVAVSAMILPGISGSLILVILGQYEYITAALSRFTDALLTVKQTGIEGITEAAPPIIVFVTGAVIGLFSIANLVERALKKYRTATMTFLVSMIVGALRAPVEEVNIYLSEQGIEWVTVLPEFVGAAVIGGIIVFVLDYRTLSDSIT